MDKKSQYLFLIFLLVMLCAAALSYYRIVVMKDYGVVETQESLITLPEF